MKGNKGTQQSYSKKLGLWTKSSDRKKTNYLQRTVDFSNFVKPILFFSNTPLSLKSIDTKTRALNVPKFTLSVFMILERFDVGKHPLKIVI